MATRHPQNEATGSTAHQPYLSKNTKHMSGNKKGPQ